MAQTNCKNCGAILGNGRYCQYCGTDTARTEHIVLKTPIINVPVKNIVATFTAPKGLKDEAVKKYLVQKICDKIMEDIESMDIKINNMYNDPIDFTVTYMTKFSYAFL